MDRTFGFLLIIFLLAGTVALETVGLYEITNFKSCLACPPSMHKNMVASGVAYVSRNSFPIFPFEVQGSYTNTSVRVNFSITTFSFVPPNGTTFLTFYVMTPDQYNHWLAGNRTYLSKADFNFTSCVGGCVGNASEGGSGMVIPFNLVYGDGIYYLVLGSSNARSSSDYVIARVSVTLIYCD